MWKLFWWSVARNIYMNVFVIFSSWCISFPACIDFSNILCNVVPVITILWVCGFCWIQITITSLRMIYHISKEMIYWAMLFINESPKQQIFNELFFWNTTLAGRSIQIMGKLNFNPGTHLLILLGIKNPQMSSKLDIAKKFLKPNE